MFRPSPPWFWLSLTVSAIGVAFLLWPTITRVARMIGSAVTDESGVVEQEPSHRQG